METAPAPSPAAPNQPFLMARSVLIDSGTGVGDLTLDEMRQMDHIFSSVLSEDWLMK